jgi:hypothetical protein
MLLFPLTNLPLTRLAEFLLIPILPLAMPTSALCHLSPLLPLFFLYSISRSPKPPPPPLRSFLHSSSPSPPAASSHRHRFVTPSLYLCEAWRSLPSPADTQDMDPPASRSPPYTYIYSLTTSRPLTLPPGHSILPTFDTTSATQRTPNHSAHVH